MKNTIKHENILRPKPSKDNLNYNRLQFICRGCSLMESRRAVWAGFIGSMANDPINQDFDNSYLTLEEEPDNHYDSNAIQVVCRGEFFGTAGYVGREFTVQIKDILSKCHSYRVDMVDWSQGNLKEIPLILTWEC